MLGVAARPRHVSRSLFEPPQEERGLAQLFLRSGNIHGRSHPLLKVLRQPLTAPASTRTRAPSGVMGTGATPTVARMKMTTAAMRRKTLGPFMVDSSSG